MTRPSILHSKMESPQAIKYYFLSGNPEIVPISGGRLMSLPYSGKRNRNAKLQFEHNLNF